MSDPGAIAWFRKPTPVDGDPYAGGTLNVAYQLLDLPVVRGASDRALLEDATGEPTGALSHARLLELVAAFGGVLRGFGVVPGDRVAVDLAGGREAVVALLAAARLGAAGVAVPAGLPSAELVRLVSSTRPRVAVSTDDAALSEVLAGCDHRPEAVVTTGEPAPGSDTLPWDLVIRAGRTDPAPAAEIGPGSASLLLWPSDGATAGTDVPRRTTVEQALLAIEVSGTVPLTTDALLSTLFG